MTDLSSAIRVVDAGGLGWYQAGSQATGFHWTVSYADRRGISPVPDITALEAARGPLRPVLPVTGQDEAALREQFAAAGRKAVTSLCAALCLVYADLVAGAVDAGEPRSYVARRRLLAGREGSWESGALMELVLLGMTLKPSRVDGAARDALGRVILRWVTGPDRYTEVADTLACVVSSFAHEHGGWRAVADQWLQPGGLARDDFTSTYRLLYSHAPDFNPGLL
jgi:hypothetical protein